MIQSSSSRELKRIFDEVKQAQSDTFHFRSDEWISSAAHFIEDLDPGAIDDHARNVFMMKLFTKFMITQDEENIPNLLLDIFVSHKWDESFIRNTLITLLDVSKASVLVASKDFRTLLEKNKKTISWYNILYCPTPQNWLNGKEIMLT
jgi:hypothetical protein